jgi:ubiquinone/menaquinone biosynthesis C-methylase UbiE
MPEQTANRFDRWYAQMADDEVRHRLVSDCLGLPPSWRVTGLLSADGLAEVTAALALEPGQLLIDLGCGRGGYGREIARVAGVDLIGVDSSIVAITQARQDAGQDGVDGPAHFRVADFESTGLPDRVADAVVCIDSYQFASSLRALAEEMWRISRPGARVVLTGAMPRALLGESASPLEQALINAGWTEVRVRARPDWLATEARLWQAVAGEARSTPAVDVLRKEATEMLAAAPHIQRFIACATHP